MDNKHIIHPMLQNVVSSFVPAARPIFDAAWTAFGGQAKSEDPYAVDSKYLAYLFSLGPARWCPRY